MSITPAQIIEARRLLGWSQYRLASRMGISAQVLSNYEKNGHSRWAFDPALAREVLELAGIEFLSEGGDLGLRLRELTAKGFVSK